MLVINQNRPTVTVVCHAFNHQPYIRQTIESILAQDTSFPIELIIHDDASHDGTSLIVKEFASRYPDKVRAIVQEENQFSQGRRPPSFTFSRAQGEYLAICEGDDYWTDHRKLEKQVQAMRRFSEVDLCVHPAIQLSVLSGKTKIAFDHGDHERIIGLECVIARHNQFAPTASMLMRTKAAQAMPYWFFEEPNLPVGDAFMEAILGSKGVLYLPDAMTVYRRGVENSYTHRFQNARGPELENSLSIMLRYTKKLSVMPGVSRAALGQRLAYIRLNYALQCLAAGDRDRFHRIADGIALPRRKVIMAILKMLKYNHLTFAIGRFAFLQYRRIKR